MTSVPGTPRLPAALPAAIGAAWLFALAAQVSGYAALVHHDWLLEGGLPFGMALVLFLLAWQAMTAAMMLPSGLPLVRLFVAASGSQPRPRAALTAFLGGYALVWTLFGAAAFAGDLFVHRLAHGLPWLEAHEWLIAGLTLGLAGSFQFTALKRRCLKECRAPDAFLRQHYARGAAAAFRLGSRHGLFCVGCCWALMLVMFAAGVANLLWMAALTALMVFEKTGTAGRRAVPVAGLALIAWAALVLAHPAWLPAPFAGAL